MGLGRKGQGGGDTGNFLLPCFNLDSQRPKFSRAETFIHMTEPEFAKVNAEKVTVSVLKCFAL